MLTRTMTYPQWMIRPLRIALFIAVLTICAKIVIPIPGTPVPITMQTLGALLTGFALGPIDGTLSIVGYLGLIALGAPLDAYSRGAAVLTGPTAGYLIGFLPSAIILGLAWHRQHYKLLWSILAGTIAVVVIFIFGVIGLLPFSNGDLTLAIMRGAIPFIFVDLGKVLLAASLVKLGQESWLRWITPRRGNML